MLCVIFELGCPSLGAKRRDVVIFTPTTKRKKKKNRKIPPLRKGVYSYSIAKAAGRSSIPSGSNSH